MGNYSQNHNWRKTMSKKNQHKVMANSKCHDTEYRRMSHHELISGGSAGHLVATPRITSPTSGGIDFDGQITASPFWTIRSVYEGDHDYSRWQLSHTSDFDKVWTESIIREGNLTSWTPGSVVGSGQEWFVRVRYGSDGHRSGNSEPISFTTYQRKCLDSEEAGSKDLSFGSYREFYPGTDEMKKEVWYKNGLKYHAWWYSPSFTEIWYKDGVEVHSEEMFPDPDEEDGRGFDPGLPLRDLDQPLAQPEDYDVLDAYWVCWKQPYISNTHIGFVEDISDSRKNGTSPVMCMSLAIDDIALEKQLDKLHEIDEATGGYRMHE